MGKTVAYVAAAVVFTGIGALVAGLAVWYGRDPIHEMLSSESRKAQCVLQGSTGNSHVNGTLILSQLNPKSYVHVSGDIYGLTEGNHGFHIHMWGVGDAALSGCRDAAGHYNPRGFNHSSPNATERHVGDLGNIFSDGISASVNIKDDIVTLWGMESVVGRSVVVHAGEDDLGLGGAADSHKTGNAGGRVACCNIYLVPDSS